MSHKIVGTLEASREIRRLSTLLDISQALSGTLDIRQAFHHVLEILERHHRVTRGAVVLVEEEGGELRVAASIGLPTAGQHARYRVGEGITGRVVESGKPVVVPQASREPLFLNRAGARRDLSRNEVTFVCVPLVVDRRTTGAIWLDLPYKRDRDYDRSLKYYRLVASMLAQAIRMHGLVQAEKQRLVAENTQLRGELQERYAFRNIVGASGPMREVFDQVAQVARTNTTVLIRGESGTGKELIAHAIHYNSPRARKAFIKVNCAALPDSLIESELFGYEKGAFTGAQARKKGRFELAEGGTLFLDEIGDLNPQTQVKLLRVLQEREFERLGGTSTIKSNVRLIVATHRDLEKAIADGGFREDLYYRLNVFTIFAPPLRQRKADVMLLADHFLEKYSAEDGHRIKRISTPAIDMLVSYHWPGNVRELENTIARAALVCDGSVIHAHHLPPTLQTAEASGTVPRLSLTESVEAYEKDILQDALKTSRGNGAKAAKLLHTTERILHYKVQKYGIRLDRFRS